MVISDDQDKLTTIDNRIEVEDLHPSTSKTSTLDQHVKSCFFLQYVAIVHPLTPKQMTETLMEEGENNRDFMFEEGEISYAIQRSIPDTPNFSRLDFFYCLKI